LDFDAERARLRKEQQNLSRQLESVEGQLGNEQFLSRAPEKVVEALRHRKIELTLQTSKVAETLEQLG
jgi:valyl-tRNA synthetase